MATRSKPTLGRVGKTQRLQAQRLMEAIERDLANDPSALDLIARVVRELAVRSRARAAKL